MHDSIDETALVAALKAGEEWAFELMVRTFGGRLLAVARRFMRNEEDARDVVQSAYLSAFRALDQFEGSSQLSTWLHRIVVNTALMRLRSQRRKPEESIEDLLPSFVEDGHHVEQFTFWNRVTGPYKYYWFSLLLCNLLAPQALWLRKVRDK